jgi:hypothetical protein
MKHSRPTLTVEQVLAWADEHHRRTGEWPRRHSGPVPCGGGDTWCAVHMALVQGHRGLPGGETLSRFLARYRGPFLGAPPLTIEQILRWADEYRDRMKKWPAINSGPVAGQGALTWGVINDALAHGSRGLPGGGSLARLLAEHRGARSRRTAPKLTEEQILAWARSHWERTGVWPGARSGPIPEAPGETWGAVYQAVYQGLRGLPGGSSLAQLLAERGSPR